ncbi:hypothetical protein THRCLA_20725 [Thraustotheca clavata]|uniref:Complex 1 LYR protein domain-containing protein n=1 Tax=Thraustotheca clavata TaxID=74557 RepID=A0A1W0A459_9STRA|nr:hypothetical protein THRCLA_20725 [Thraustotheca clavata]
MQAKALYKACLRSAAKCPAQVHRDTMKAYVGLKFREHMHVQDKKTIALLLKEGQEELDRMNYYHSMYAASQREKVTTNEPRPLVASCPACNQAYSSPEARFCSNCGVLRPSLV